MNAANLDIARLLRETFIVRAEHHRRLGSTNDRARQCAADDAEGSPLLVVADDQTAGRGRGDHRWWTAEGSLAFSLLLTPGQTGGDGRTHAPLVALAGALAVVEAVVPLLGTHRPGIRWPNDVVAAGGKLSGVLVEALPDGRRIVGIGVNTNNSRAQAPTDLRASVATLRDLTGVRHDQTAILIDLLQRLEDALGELASDPGRIAARANAWCVQRGEQVVLHFDEQSVAGRCAGIAPDGALLLDTPDGRRAFRHGVPGDPAAGH